MRKISAAVMPFLLVIVGVGSAHHSPLTVYVTDQLIEIEGMVTDYRFDNPHVRIFVDVVNEDGVVENWVGEGGTPNILLRNGWSPELFQSGDLIHISGNPARATESRFIHMLNVRHGDGTEPRVMPDTPVFTTTAGKPIEPKTFSEHWYACLRALGLRVRGL